MERLQLLIQEALRQVTETREVDDDAEEARLDEAARAYILTRAQEISGLDAESAEAALQEWAAQIGFDLPPQ